MTSVPVTPGSWVDFFRRNERRIAAGWLAATLVVVAAVVIAPVRIRLLCAMCVAADRWEGRWERQLAEGVRLVTGKRYSAAAAPLSHLDAEYPARNVRYGRDKEREYLLRLLATSYEAL